MNPQASGMEDDSHVDQNHPLVLYDGVCGLCNRAVRFMIRRDRKARFRFATLEGERGQAILREHDLPADLDSIVLVEQVNGAPIVKRKVSWESTAALRIARGLSFPWPLLSICLLVPRFLRDPVYRWIARNRYKWFGTLEQCPLPDPAQAHRFLS